MAVTLFAAIEVGSYEVEMKIFEFSPRKGVAVLDHIRYRIELGTDTYTRGKIGVTKTEELCKVLNDFLRIMKGYKVNAYRACATSAIREARNRLLVLEYIKRMTGITVETLDNSEQRFLDYKSLAFGVPEFYRIMQEGTAIVDVGGGSIQLYLFDNDKLVMTQNMRVGNLRIREKIADLMRESTHMENVVEELINHELESFKKMYLKDREIKHLIVIGDYIRDLMKQLTVTRDDFMDVYRRVVTTRPEEIAKEHGIPSESTSLILPSMVIYKRLIEETGAQSIWLPGMDLSDGIAFDYAQKNKVMKIQHDFDDDIIAAARNIAKRYQCSKSHIKYMESMALAVFDRIKKHSGMDGRDRLLLQIAVILHGCGKYINLSEGAECSFSIIMATEIIGLSLKERRIIANVVRYNTLEFTCEDIIQQPGMDQKEYLLITKLVAILRIANAMDRSHKQKFTSFKISPQDGGLAIIVDSQEDITLEKGLFPPKADYFEDVFHIRPFIRQKKTM